MSHNDFDVADLLEYFQENSNPGPKEESQPETKPGDNNTDVFPKISRWSADGSRLQSNWNATDEGDGLDTLDPVISGIMPSQSSPPRCHNDHDIHATANTSCLATPQQKHLDQWHSRPNTPTSRPASPPPHAALDNVQRPVSPEDATERSAVEFNDLFKCPCGDRIEMKAIVVKRWRYLDDLPALSKDNVNALYQAPVQDDAMDTLHANERLLDPSYVIYARQYSAMMEYCGQFDGRLGSEEWSCREDHFNKEITKLDIKGAPWLDCVKSVYCLSILHNRLMDEVLDDSYFAQFITSSYKNNDAMSRIQTGQMIISSMAVRTRLHWPQISSSSFERALLRSSFQSSQRRAKKEIVYGEIPWIPSEFMRVLKIGVDHVVLHWREVVAPLVLTLEVHLNASIFEVVLSFVRLLMVSYPVFNPLLVMDTSHRKQDSNAKHTTIHAQHSVMAALIKAAMKLNDKGLWMQLIALINCFITRISLMIHQDDDNLPSIGEVRRSALMLDLPVLRLLNNFCQTYHPGGRNHDIYELIEDSKLARRVISADSCPFAIASVALGTFLDHPKVAKFTHQLPTAVIQWALLIYLPLIREQVMRKVMDIEGLTNHECSARGQDAQQIEDVICMTRELLRAFITRPRCDHKDNGTLLYSTLFKLLQDIETQHAAKEHIPYVIIDENLLFSFRFFLSAMSSRLEHQSGDMQRIIQGMHEFVTIQLGYE